jgi:hypothetical protein
MFSLTSGAVEQSGHHRVGFFKAINSSDLFYSDSPRPFTAADNFLVFYFTLCLTHIANALLEQK